MRLRLASLASLGLLVTACPDDTDPRGDGPTLTSSPDPTTTGTPPDDTGTTGEDPPTSGDATETSDPDTGSSDGGDSSSSTGEGASCGNGVLEGDEQCDGGDLGGATCQDEGYDGGELDCSLDCQAFDTNGCWNAVCGNGMVEGPEACDGGQLQGASCGSEGFDSGSLTCLGDCSGYDTSGCGTCGNVIIDGDEVCDDIVLLGQTCISQGFDSGQLGCAADCLSYDTAACGLCGNGVLENDEICDGMQLGGATCDDFGAMGGTLGCTPACQPDLSACNLAPVQYDVSLPNQSSTQSNYFRGHGYQADGNGQLLDFEVYLDLAGACDLDFYVFEAPAYGGPYTQLQRTTVNSGPGLAYYPAGLATVPIVNGNYYILGVAWNCAATYYWDSSGAFAGIDAGVGIFNVSHWDNGYPGASDMYVPPNTGTGNTVYVHRVFYAE